MPFLSKRATRQFVYQNSVLFIIFSLFILLSILGLLPTLVLTWKASGGWPNPFEIIKKIWELNEDNKWHQLLAISTVALTMATSLMGSVCFFALFGAAYHVRKVETASRAELLLNLEQQVTNSEMIRAQEYLSIIFLDAMNEIQESYPALDHMEMVKKISEKCHIKLVDMRKNNDRKYHIIFRNCEFFETVGIMVKQQYVDLEDIISRFEVGIERVHTCFNYHLAERRKESWASQLFFKHIEDLFEKVKHYREQRNA